MNNPRSAWEDNAGQKKMSNNPTCLFHTLQTDKTTMAEMCVPSQLEVTPPDRYKIEQPTIIRIHIPFHYSQQYSQPS